METETSIIKRLRAADYALKLLSEGELPYLRKFVMSARVDVCRAPDIDGESQLHEELPPKTQSRGFIKTHFDEELKFYVVHEEGSGDQELAFLARCLGEVAAVTFAALGLKIDPPTESLSVPPSS